MFRNTVQTALNGEVSLDGMPVSSDTSFRHVLFRDVGNTSVSL